MTPQEFPVINVAGAFNVDDVVKITGTKSDFRGIVTESKTKNYGVPPVPGLALMIALDRGDLTEFKGGGFAGYGVTKNGGGASGTVRAPCALKYAARLMKSSELQKMVDVAEKLIERAATAKNDAYAKKWFGTKATTPQELQKIHLRCADLHRAVAGLSTVIFQCAASEMLGAISKTDPLRNGPTCRIQLGRGFTYDRYSWGERVCTIIHEMTHWFLDTTDEALTDGSVAYGAACLRLANSDIDCKKALNNADTWAYYIGEYRSVAEAGDWSNFTEQEILARGPFVSGAYNVVQSLVARYN
jgi:hypothetical protein